MDSSNPPVFEYRPLPRSIFDAFGGLSEAREGALKPADKGQKVEAEGTTDLAQLDDV